MRYIKKFNEAINSEEDMSDLLLELIDNEFISFESVNFVSTWDTDGGKVIGALINYEYTIFTPGDRINNFNIKNYINNLSKLSQICDRWGLKFSIWRNELTIIGDAPQYIQDFIINNDFTMFRNSDDNYISWETKRYREDQILISSRVTKNLEFFIAFDYEKEKIDKFIEDKIKISKSYQLKFVRNSGSIFEYIVLPT